MSENPVRISFDDKHSVEGTVTVPKYNIGGLVIFVHGSGSSGYSPRNTFLSNVLNESGLATLLIDLLSPEESKIDNITREYRFNTKLLINRLLDVTDWAMQNKLTKDLRIGYFGSSTGAAVAIETAIQRTSRISTIVARSGRPDLVNKKMLQKLTSSILLIVGSNDPSILDISKKTLGYMTHSHLKEIILIPGATHLFEEPGKIEQLSRIASKWFKDKLLNNILDP